MKVFIEIPEREGDTARCRGEYNVLHSLDVKLGEKWPGLNGIVRGTLSIDGEDYEQHDDRAIS